MAIESVTTLELAEGDTITHYGAILRLSDRREHPDAGPRPIVTFATELVGEENGGADALLLSFIRGRDGYNVQGNELARWARII